MDSTTSQSTTTTSIDASSKDSNPPAPKSEATTLSTSSTTAKESPQDDEYANIDLDSTSVKVTGGRWSPEEDARLREVVKEHGPKTWKVISKIAFNGTRTDVQCLHRWQKVLRPGLVKGPWTKEENEIIINLINTYGIGNIKWSEIASALPGRLGKQCRERWVNHLDPNLKKSAWTEAEDRILMEQQKLLGNKWRDIAVFLPGRSENSVKNRWNSARRKRKRSEAAAAANSNSENKATSSTGTPSSKQGATKVTKTDVQNPKRKLTKKNLEDGTGGSITKNVSKKNGAGRGTAQSRRGKSGGGRGGKKTTPRLTKAQLEEMKQQEMRELMEEQNAANNQQQGNPYQNAMMMGHGIPQYGSYTTNPNNNNMYNHQMNVLPSLPGGFGGTTSPHSSFLQDYNNPHMQQAILLGMAGIGAGAAGSISPTFMTGGMMPTMNIGMNLNDPLSVMFHNQQQQMQYRNHMNPTTGLGNMANRSNNNTSVTGGNNVSQQHTNNQSFQSPQYNHNNLPQTSTESTQATTGQLQTTTSRPVEMANGKTTAKGVNKKVKSPKKSPAKKTIGKKTTTKVNNKGKNSDVVKPKPNGYGVFSGFEVVGNGLSEKQMSLLRESPTKFDYTNDKSKYVRGARQHHEGLQVMGLKSLDNGMLQDQDAFELFTFDDLVGDVSDFYSNSGNDTQLQSGQTQQSGQTHPSGSTASSTMSTSSTPVPRNSTPHNKHYLDSRPSSTSPIPSSFEGIGGMVHLPGISNTEGGTNGAGNYDRIQHGVPGARLHNRPLSPATVNALLGNMAPSS